MLSCSIKIYARVVVARGHPLPALPPLPLLFRYVHEEWLLGDTLCRLYPFFFYGNVGASLMNMVAITINRYAGPQMSERGTGLCSLFIHTSNFGGGGGGGGVMGRGSE